MPRHIDLHHYLSTDELEPGYRAAKEPHERSQWQILWLLSRGQTAKHIADSTSYSRYWIGQIARCVTLQHQPALIRSATLFPWWP